MSKHTPGPWAWREGVLYPECDSPNVHAIIDTEGCRVHRDRPIEEWTVEVEANRALLATAPDLLAAAHAAIAYDAAIQSCANDPDKMSSYCSAEGESLDHLYAAWIDASRTAIAKATA